jgi:hypothetical protein
MRRNRAGSEGLCQQLPHFQGRNRRGGERPVRSGHGRHLRSELFLHAVANDSIRTGDNLMVTKEASGAITVRYVHRGTAYEITTDTSGKVTLPTTSAKKRTIGHTDNTIHPDFSSTGTTTAVDWKKVWDASIADGKQVGGTASKTGKIMSDIADSTFFVWQGVLQLSLDGTKLKINGSLDANGK